MGGKTKSQLHKSKKKFSQVFAVFLLGIAKVHLSFLVHVKKTRAIYEELDHKTV